MAEHPDDPGAELGGWLRDEASRLDAAAPPIGADEAMVRPTPDLAPRRFRWGRGSSLPAFPGTERRVPALAGAAVAAVLIGSVAGFAFGRASAPDKTVTASAGDASRETAATTTAPAPPFAAETRSDMAVPGDDRGYYGPTLTHLGTRTTSDGVTIRAYTAEYPAPPTDLPADTPLTTVVPTEKCDPNGGCTSAGSGVVGSPPWNPPPQCSASSELWLATSTDEAIGQWSSPGYGLTDQLGSTSYSAFGQGEGAPYSVAAARVGDQVASVRATWPDGFVDTADAVGGWAYVGHKAEGEPTLDALAADGSVIESAQASEGYRMPAECMPPPPPLPEPGDEQPDDPDAVRNDVAAAIAAAFPDATTEVGEMVFTSASEGAAYVTVSYGGEKGYTELMYFFLEDGAWQVGYGGCDRGDGPDQPCAEPAIPSPIPPTTAPAN